jgi:hypothetical protein
MAVEVVMNMSRVVRSALFSGCVLAALSVGVGGGAVRADDLIRGATTAPAAPQDGLIGVSSPDYGADVKGDTTITLSAPGYEKLTVTCWKQGGGKFGTKTTIATPTVDASGAGTFVFPADRFPHGPLVLTINGLKGNKQDNCYLQLYNKGGVSWNEGIPKTTPPGAEGLKLVFEDDFNTMPSISSTDMKATYYDHKPPGGTQDFSNIPFTSADKPNSPFAQMDTYLRIRVSSKANSAGIISSLKNDGSGIKVSAPCYFECKFLAQSAVGSWPAFWLLSDNVSKPLPGCDELDIIEAVGGEGPGSPNAPALYQITPHAWAQGPLGDQLQDRAYKAMKNPCDMHKFGVPSNWCDSFHTYGCRVNKDVTTYYLDNIEVGHHHTLPLSKTVPMYFLINFATGGGWPVDLSRYNGQIDMYVDFVRVYADELAK